MPEWIKTTVVLLVFGWFMRITVDVKNRLKRAGTLERTKTHRIAKGFLFAIIDLLLIAIAYWIIAR